MGWKAVEENLGGVEVGVEVEMNLCAAVSWDDFSRGLAAVNTEQSGMGESERVQ